jgi:hypothetical protein
MTRYNNDVDNLSGLIRLAKANEVLQDAGLSEALVIGVSIAIGNPFKPTRRY